MVGDTFLTGLSTKKADADDIRQDNVRLLNSAQWEDRADSDWTNVWTLIEIGTSLWNQMTHGAGFMFSCDSSVPTTCAVTFGSFIEFTFTGTGVRWLYPTNPDDGATVELYLDGVRLANVDTKTPSLRNLVSGARNKIAQYYEVAGLEKKQHTLKVRNRTEGVAMTNAFAYTTKELDYKLTGPLSMTLAEGYTATSTDAYVLDGSPVITTDITPASNKIAWNDTTKKIDITAGLSAGKYTLKLTADGKHGTANTLTFTLTVTASDGADAAITLDAGTTYQTIDGFGTFLSPQTPHFFEVCADLYYMDEYIIDEILDLLFDPVDGAGFNIFRLEAGNGLYYVESGSRGYDLIVAEPYPASPNMKPTYQKGGSFTCYVDLVKRVAERGVDIFYLNAWSAPAYMKENNSPSGLPDHSKNYLKAGWEDAYADYLVQFLRYYDEIGINITHIGPYNEADHTSDYQSMRAKPEHFVEIVRALGRALENSDYGKFSDVKIVGADTTACSRAEPYFVAILADAETRNYLGVASVHMYDDRVFASPAATAAGINTWMAEFAPIIFSDPPDPWNPDYTGDWGGAYTSNNVMRALNNGVSAYIDWSAVNENGLANQHLFSLRSKSEYKVSKRLWAMANYSRFILPGAVRIDSAVTGDIDGVLTTTAFRNKDGSLVVVIINDSASPMKTTINGVWGETVTPYVTNDAYAIEPMSDIGLAGASVTLTVPALSTVTYKFDDTQLNKT